jgi:hypothetical protein
MPLTPSERVNLLKIIGERLGTERWQFIDVVLNEFGIETPEPFTGSPVDYVINTARQVPDNVLIDLATHLGHQSGELISSSLEFTFWRKGMLRLFISTLQVNECLRVSCRRIFLGMAFLHSSRTTT